MFYEHILSVQKKLALYYTCNDLNNTPMSGNH